MREYKISVIVPIYNSEKYLDRCIQSIINQTYKNLEIILVNDGSSDGSLSVCDRYGKLDNRIVIIDSTNEGVIVARKKGVRIASGDYVTFVDSDDWIDECAYSMALDELIDEDMLCYGMIEDYGYKSIQKLNNIKSGIYNVDEIINSIYPQMLCSGAFFRFGILPNLVCKLFKRELLLEVLDKISDNITVGEDVDFTYHALANISSVRIMDIKPYHYVQLAGSLVRKTTPMLCIRKLYEDLRCINILGISNEQWEKQLAAYFAFLLLLKNTDMVVRRVPFFEEKLAGRRIIIYGAGNYGLSVRSALQYMDDTIIVGTADRDWEAISKNVEDVCCIDNLLCQRYDMIYIAILDESVCINVKNMLMQKGIDEFKIAYLGMSEILRYNILEIVKEISEE